MSKHAPTDSLGSRKGRLTAGNTVDVAVVANGDNGTVDVTVEVGGAVEGAVAGGLELDGLTAVVVDLDVVTGEDTGDAEGESEERGGEHIR